VDGQGSGVTVKSPPAKDIALQQQEDPCFGRGQVEQLLNGQHQDIFVIHHQPGDLQRPFGREGSQAGELEQPAIELGLGELLTQIC
jgi:hypothetical protein